MNACFLEAQMSPKKPRTNHRPNGRDKERYRLFAEAYLNIGDKSTYMKAIPSAIAAGYKEGWSHGHAFKLSQHRQRNIRHGH